MTLMAIDILRGEFRKSHRAGSNASRPTFSRRTSDIDNQPELDGIPLRNKESQSCFVLQVT